MGDRPAFKVWAQVRIVKNDSGGLSANTPLGTWPRRMSISPLIDQRQRKSQTLETINLLYPNLKCPYPGSEWLEKDLRCHEEYPRRS